MVIDEIIPVPIELLNNLGVMAYCGHEIALPVLLIGRIAVNRRVTGIVVTVDIITEGPVEVPHRSENKLGAVVQDVLMVAPHTLGIEHFKVIDVLIQHHVASHIVRIDMVGDMVIVHDSSSKVFEPMLDILQLQHR